MQEHPTWGCSNILWPHSILQESLGGGDLFFANSSSSPYYLISSTKENNSTNVRIAMYISYHIHLYFKISSRTRWSHDNIARDYDRNWACNPLSLEHGRANSFWIFTEELCACALFLETCKITILTYFRVFLWFYHPAMTGIFCYITWWALYGMYCHRVRNSSHNTPGVQVSELLFIGGGLLDQVNNR